MSSGQGFFSKEAPDRPTFFLLFFLPLASIFRGVSNAQKSPRNTQRDGSLRAVQGKMA